MAEKRNSRQVENLTDSRVRRLTPGDKERIIHDSAIPGLAIRVQPGGSKSWTFRRALNGQARRVTLGLFPAMNVRQARAAVASSVLEGRAAPADTLRLRAKGPLF